MARKKVNQSLNSQYLENVLKATKQLKNSESARVQPASLETVIEKMKFLNSVAKAKHC